jgi:ribosomal protein S18 acetylase RimI-like enzyme
VASERGISHGLADPRCYLFVAMETSDHVGLLSAYRFPNVVAGGGLVYLCDIEVRVEHRRKGIGEANATTHQEAHRMIRRRFHKQPEAKHSFLVRGQNWKTPQRVSPLSCAIDTA